MLKDEMYKGHTIKFANGIRGVFAKSNKIREVIGIGLTKVEATNMAKDTIDKIEAIAKFSKKNVKPDYTLLNTKDSIRQFRDGKGKVMLIYTEEDAESPREWDNLGIMACQHTRYNLGDFQLNTITNVWTSGKNIKTALKNEHGALHIKPLYLYDHSGLRIKIGSFVGTGAQHANWDSGMVGYIYTTKEKIKMMGVKEKDIDKILEGEVEIYDQYLSGDVYRYTVFEWNGNDWENVDSVGGYYGYDVRKSGILDEHPEFKDKEYND